MSDHWDAPGMKPPNMDARIDICDIYEEPVILTADDEYFEMN